MAARKFYTTDQKQAERCKRACESHEIITEAFSTESGGTKVSGTVQTVVEYSDSRPRAWSITVDSNFELINMQGEPSGIVRLRYGSAPNDPQPFILTLMPQHVAHSLSKTLPITLQEIEAYARKNAAHLRSVAQNAKDRGLNSEVLQ